MKKSLLIFTVLLSVAAFAENQTIFSVGFEESEGYTEGKVAGQNGWDKLAWWANDEVFVVNDDTQAASGNQFIQSNPAGVNVQLNGIDVSSAYREGLKLIVSAYCQADFVTGGQPMSVRFHCLGTSGKTYDVEIVEFNFNQDGSGNAYVTGKDLTFSGLVPGQYYKFGVQIDPATKAVEKLFVGDNSYEGDDMQYKSVTADGCGSLPDGIRIYNGAGKLDDFTIEVVPEPAVFGLLALFGLFFIRKQG